ncbi:PEBP-like protein [Acephala macrosclerotiorum]|nr:PEBP-like protein [Acephala macrosclerotiorum]
MDYLERTVSYFTKNVRGHDAKLFFRGPAFKSFPEPTITVTSPDCGPSSSLLDVDHTQDGKDHIPSLTWSLPASIPAERVREYLILVEDADGPIGVPIMHGGFYHIPPTKTSLGPEDLVKAEGEKRHVVKGGFKYAKNLRGSVYGGPRPLKGHGEHRYFYEIIALSETVGVEEKGFSAWPKKDELVKGVEGKVLGWGQWIGVAIRN